MDQLLLHAVNLEMSLTEDSNVDGKKGMFLPQSWKFFRVYDPPGGHCRNYTKRWIFSRLGACFGLLWRFGASTGQKLML